MRWFIWWLWALAALTGCSRPSDVPYQPTLNAQQPTRTQVYRVGVHPLHNPQRLMEVYGPVIDYLNVAMPGAQFVLEASRNYESYEDKLYAGYFDFALPNPYQTVLALQRGYRVIAKMGDDAEFRGIILVRKDANLENLKALKGQTVAYPAPTALAATMMPQYYLQQHGLDVNNDIKNLYVGSQESAIMNVVRGHTVASATWPVPWKRFQMEYPALAEQLDVRWQTEPLVNNSWVARKEIPEAVVQRFTQLLVALKDTPDGQEILQRLPLSTFEPATNATYAPVQGFLERFSREVRPIEH